MDDHTRMTDKSRKYVAILPEVRRSLELAKLNCYGRVVVVPEMPTLFYALSKI